MPEFLTYRLQAAKDAVEIARANQYVAYNGKACTATVTSVSPDELAAVVRVEPTGGVLPTGLPRLPDPYKVRQ